MGADVWFGLKITVAQNHLKRISVLKNLKIDCIEFFLPTTALLIDTNVNNKDLASTLQDIPTTALVPGSSQVGVGELFHIHSSHRRVPAYMFALSTHAQPLTSFSRSKLNFLSPSNSFSLALMVRTKLSQPIDSTSSFEVQLSTFIQ